MDISYDRFIRTTDDYHEAAVRLFFQNYTTKVTFTWENSEGWYCTPCEFFLDRKPARKMVSVQTVAEK